MGFVIAWVVYLLAFLLGSLAAWLIAGVVTDRSRAEEIES